LEKRIKERKKEVCRLRGFEEDLHISTDEKDTALEEKEQVEQEKLVLSGEVVTLTSDLMNLRRELDESNKVSKSETSALTQRLSHTNTRLQRAIASQKDKETLLDRSRSETKRLHGLYVTKSQTAGDIEGNLLRTQKKLESSKSSFVALQKKI
jgi:hypothetical protein